MIGATKEQRRGRQVPTTLQTGSMLDAYMTPEQSETYLFMISIVSSSIKTCVRKALYSWRFNDSTASNQSHLCLTRGMIRMPLNDV